MNVLSILDSDMAGVCEAIIDGSIGKVDFKRRATVCKYIVPEGYGLQSAGSQRLEVDEKGINKLGALLYYAAVNERDGGIYTTSSRSVGLVGIAETIEDAERICEKAALHVSGEHIYHRRDIGTMELIQSKLEGMKALR